MNRTITIKGIGNVSKAPDMVVIDLKLQAIGDDYELAMELAQVQLEQTRTALMNVGLEKNDIQTTDFNVRSEYENRRTKNGEYHREFIGYGVHHQLKVSFSFDSKYLGTVLNAISASGTSPEISISFTVKDKESIKEELLCDAAANARKKAEILCKASGVKLGNLVSISYDWAEINVYSHARYLADDMMMNSPSSIDIEPENIDASDSVVFVWEIE